MKKLWRFLGVIILCMIVCAGCGIGQADVNSSENSGEPAGISEKINEQGAQGQSTQEQSAQEQNVQMQNDGKNADYGNANAVSEGQQASPDTNDKRQGSASVGEGGQSSLSMEERYKDILLNKGTFICTDLKNKELSIGEIKEAVTDDDDISVAVPKFAAVDLNGDGEDEIVLWIQINGVSDYGFEILWHHGNAVYGYTLPYRSFMELKTDGTFIFSGGAADSGIGRLGFSEDGYAVDMIYYSESGYDSNNELKVRYFANGEVCPEEEFNEAMNRQEEKQSVEGHDLTEDNVNTALQ